MPPQSITATPISRLRWFAFFRAVDRFPSRSAQMVVDNRRACAACGDIDDFLPSVASNPAGRPSHPCTFLNADPLMLWLLTNERVALLDAHFFLKNGGGEIGHPATEEVGDQPTSR